MNSLVPANFGAVSSVFAGQQPVDDLSSGIQSSFGLIGYKGKVWSIRYRGAEQQLLRDDGDGPRGSIEVVILKASANVSKIWYEQGYVEGSNAAPDCFSNNGIVPEPTSQKKQCDTCALCPHNQWGSRITPAGKSGKSCADSKRVAVVPVGDLENEAYGGPMLLRIPAASLQDSAAFGQKMQQLGYPYYSIATKIAFDPQESYPKFVFSALRPLNDAEGKIVMGLRDSHTVQRVLSENDFVAPAGATPAADQPIFEQSEAGARTEAQPQQQASVGDQARAAAAANAQAHGKAAGFGATKAVAPAVEPSNAGTVQNPQVSQTTAAVEQPKETDAERELRELKAQLAAQQKPVEQKPAEQPKETEAERELRELKAQMAAQQKPVEQAKEPVTIEGNVEADTAQQAATTAPGVATASDFEANLDDMLANLLP